MAQSEQGDDSPDIEALWATERGLPVSEDDQEKLWHGSTDPVEMLNLLEPAFADEVLSERKIRLFVCACCRRVWDRLSANTRRDHVELAERYVDGRATRKQFGVTDWKRIKPKELAMAACCRWDFDPYGGMYYIRYELLAAIKQDDLGDLEEAAQAAILRDIFRAPYPRPVTFDLAWNTSDVVALAQGIYEERAFDRMPILADALEEAGCDNAQMLSHCREPAEHVRGCWVVDLVLGKA